MTDCVNIKKWELKGIVGKCFKNETECVNCMSSQKLRTPKNTTIARWSLKSPLQLERVWTKLIFVKTVGINC